MSQNVMNRFAAALQSGQGLRDDFIYYMPFEEYQSFPDPFPRRVFTVSEVQETIHRYANPETPAARFEHVETVGVFKRG